MSAALKLTHDPRAIDPNTHFFSYTEAFRRLSAFFREKNEALKLNNQKPISATYITTAEHMLRLYFKQISKLQKQNTLSWESFPPFLTTNTGFAKSKGKWGGMTPRTVQRHREELEKAGFITTQTSTGYSGVGICFQAALIVGEKLACALPLPLDFYPTSSKKTEGAPSAISPPDATKCRTLVQLNNTKNKERSNSDVNMWKGVPSAPGAEQSIGELEMDWNTTEQVNQSNSQEEKGENSGGGADVDKSKSCGKHEMPQDLAEIRRKHAFSLWNYAKMRIYRHGIYTDRIDGQIVENIEESVFCNFLSTKKFRDRSHFLREIQGVYDQALKAVDYQEKAVKKGKYWLPDSASWYFFKGNNRNGFIQNWKRMYDYQRTSGIARLIREHLNPIKEEARKFRNGLGKFNPKNEAYKPISAVTLFKRHERRIANTKNKKLMVAFQEFVANHLPYTKLSVTL